MCIISAFLLKQIFLKLLWLLAGFLVMIGLVKQVEGTLAKGLKINSSDRFWGFLTKFSGLGLVASLVFVQKMDGLVWNFAVFMISFIATLIVFLVAKKALIR